MLVLGLCDNKAYAPNIKNQEAPIVTCRTETFRTQLLLRHSFGVVQATSTST